MVSNVYLDVANVDRYDLILGNKFMYDMNIILDIHQRIIYVNGFNGCKLKALHPEEEQQLLNTIHARKIAKAKPKPKLLLDNKQTD